MDLFYEFFGLIGYIIINLLGFGLRCRFSLGGFCIVGGSGIGCFFSI